MTPRRRSRRGPKRITQQQITGQQGVNFVEGVVLEMGFGWHPTNQALEAGIDGIIEIRDPETGEATNNIIQVQVKATNRRWVYESNVEFTYRCEPRDIDYWMRSNTPVVLVAVRPEGGEGYWANVKETFVDPKRRKDGFLRFEKATQRFDASAASSLMKLAVPRDTGPYMPATPHGETLVSNLLEVKSFPPNIYVASTEYRDPQGIFDWAKSHDVQLPSGWLLTEKSIRSVHDLREQPWVDLVDRGSVERFDLNEWSDSDDTDRQREFVWLMNKVLQEDMRLRHLWRSRDEKCFYFPAKRDDEGNLLPRHFGYQGLQNRTSREVASVHHHPETKEFVYCRHSAMKCSFVQVARQWFLAITPHYLYTTDGNASYPYGEELLSGMKRMELQEAVLGQVVMWARKLTQSRTLFDGNKAHPFIVFGELFRASCERGVDDDAWLRTDAVQSDDDGDDESADWGLF